MLLIIIIITIIIIRRRRRFDVLTVVDSSPNGCNTASQWLSGSHCFEGSWCLPLQGTGSIYLGLLDP